MKARLLTELYRAEFFFTTFKAWTESWKSRKVFLETFSRRNSFFFICRTASGSVESLEAELHLDNKVRFIFNVSPSE